MTYHVRVAEDGRLVAPVELARELNLKPGDSLVVDREDGRLVLKTRAQAIAEIQASVRASLGDYTGSLVDDLIAERRAEAAREDAEFEEWLSRKTPG